MTQDGVASFTSCSEFSEPPEHRVPEEEDLIGRETSHCHTPQEETDHGVTLCVVFEPTQSRLKGEIGRKVLIIGETKGRSRVMEKEQECLIARL